MIDLRLRPLADDPPIPLFHAPGCRGSDRFARIVTAAWRALPAGVTHQILESWKYLDDGPVFALVPTLPKWKGPIAGDDLQTPAFVWQDGGLLVFSADWVRHRTDEQVEAAVVHELAHIFRTRALGPGWRRELHPDRRQAYLLDERETDEQVEEWGFAMRSVRTWQGGRQGPPDRQRYPRSYRAWRRDKLRRLALAENARFTRRVRRLVNEARPPGDCRPHKSGRFVGTDTGYDRENNNAPCRLTANSGDRGRQPKDEDKSASGPGKPSSARGGSVAKAGSSRGSERKVKRQKSPQEFKKEHVQATNAAATKPVKERCELIGHLVRKGRAGNVPDYAVWECVLAVLTRGRLQSHGKHGFDVHTEIAERNVLSEGKHSEGTPGYHDRPAVRVAKLRESAAHPDAIPTYIPIVVGHGIYCHVGFDPSQNPTFQTKRGNEGGRGVASPKTVAKAIDGSGRPVPFVKLSDAYKSLDDIEHITESGYRRIGGVLKKIIGGIDMDKAKEHFRKQRENAEDAARKELITRNPEAAVREGLAALGVSPEEIDVILAKAKKKA